MKVVHCVGWYFPESLGGTEIYVDALAHELAALGIDSAIASPRDGTTADAYRQGAVSVYRYPAHTDIRWPQHWGQEPHGGFDEFASWLERCRADVFHLHSWGYGSGRHHLRRARELGLRTVLTVHTPSLGCMRGTYMFRGRSECDGRILERRCAACMLQSQGIPWPAARLGAAIPERWSAAIGSGGRLGRVGTALGMRWLAAEKRRQFDEATAALDHVVALIERQRRILIDNGAAQHKVSVVAPADPLPATGLRPARGRPPGAPLRLGFIGRWDPLKGVDVLVRAIRSLPDEVPVRLAVRAAGEQPVARSYADAVRALAGADRRIEFGSPVTREDLWAFLADCDVLAVPSQWFENAPLVILEALRAGVPVLGASIGGIPELVRPGVNGWLVGHADVAGWAAAIRGIAERRWPLPQVEPGRVRTMTDVARDMARIYAAAAP